MSHNISQGLVEKPAGCLRVKSKRKLLAGGPSLRRYPLVLCCSPRIWLLYWDDWVFQGGENLNWGKPYS